MQLTISTGSLTALKADNALRCLFHTKYTPPSRHSAVAIGLARELVQEFTNALLVHIAQANESGSGTGGGPTSSGLTAYVKLNIVSLRGPQRLFICYDMFLDGCKEEIRSEVDRSVDQPIHAIFKTGDAYHMERNAAFDKRVVGEYTRLRRMDKGPRPYFYDDTKVTLYDDGIRVEDPEALDADAADPENFEPWSSGGSEDEDEEQMDDIRRQEEDIRRQEEDIRRQEEDNVMLCQGY